MIKFEDMYGVVTLGIFPNNAELDLLKSLGVNTIWLMGTNYDLILRCRDRGINCIPYIGHTAFGDPLENVPCYIIVPDEPFMYGYTYEQVVQRAIEARKKTSKPIGFNFTWAGGIQRYFPGINDYVDFTSIDCYPYHHGGFDQGALTNTWAFIQANVRVPTYIVGQAFECAEFTYPQIKPQKDFWRPKNLGLLWYAWDGSEAGGLIKTDKSIQEAIRIAYIPPVYTKRTYTCVVCGSTLELTISSISEENVSQACPVCGALEGGNIYIGKAVKVTVITEQPWPPPTVYTCPYCEETFNTLEELNAHIESEHPGLPPAVEVPWYKKYAPHLALAGAISAVIAYFSLKKRG